MSGTSTTYTGIVYNTPEVTSGTTTSWIPVTTAWPSLSGCAESFFLYPGQPFPVAWDPGYGYFGGGTPRCLPPAATTWWEQDHQRGDGYTILSIRPIVCPAAFTTAATSVQAGSSTLVRCCPSGYALLGGEPGEVSGTCISSLTAGQILTYVAGVETGSEPTVQSTTVTSATTISGVPFDGWNVASSPTSSTIGSSNTNGSSSGNGSSVQQCPSGLSSGAKAGIGVGAGIGAVGLISLIAALVLFAKQRRQLEYSGGYTHSNFHVHGGPEPQPVPVYEMQSYASKPVEMSSMR